MFSCGVGPRSTDCILFWKEFCRLLGPLSTSRLASIASPTARTAAVRRWKQCSGGSPLRTRQLVSTSCLGGVCLQLTACGIHRLVSLPVCSWVPAFAISRTGRGGLSSLRPSPGPLVSSRLEEGLVCSVLHYPGVSEINQSSSHSSTLLLGGPEGLAVRWRITCSWSVVNSLPD